MPLFEQRASEVVTPKDIKDYTGIRYSDFGMDSDSELDSLLAKWIDQIASHMYARLKRQVKDSDEEYLAIQDILIRTVAKTVAVAQQQRSSPVVQIGDYNVGVLNTSEVIKTLNDELKPFMRKGRVDIFLSSDKE